MTTINPIGAAGTLHPMTALAERIRLILREKGWSQRELSRRADLAGSHVSLILTRLGEKVSDETIAKIASAAGASVTWLRTGEGPMWAAGEPRPSAPLPTVVVREDLPPEVRALARAFQMGAYDVEEFDALRELLRHGKPQLAPGADPVAIMSVWLAAARRMRLQGIPVTMENLAFTLAGANAGAILTALGDRTDALNDEAVAELRALGAEPPPAPVLPPKGR